MSRKPSSEQVRQRFLDFFEERGHTIVPSSSLIPRDDPTLLFTNAGMNQFKETFLGHEERPYQRAATSQKCMRVSGKHNDLENVGPSTYHHTFFEMLGNFSFGDYFKAGAIEMAWELIVDGYGLQADNLWASVYEKDDEAYDLWRTVVGIDENRLVRLGKHENFWAMGDTGPCGPCSEIHYDFGATEGCGKPTCGPDCDCGRFIELWNLVFMQFDCNAAGEMTPLPAPNIDTGAGLERVTAVLQGHRSNYDTDLFRPLIDHTAGQVGRVYGESEDVDVALRVIADHSRAVAFLLDDGVSPANEGRGYVLRRLIRRAVRFGMKLGFEDAFLHEVAGVVVERMRQPFPELLKSGKHIRQVTRAEEERFFQTLATGTRMFNELVAELRDRGVETIPGEEAFCLYDTHGLPLELIREFAQDQQLAIDEDGFHVAMEAQRERARAAWKGAAGALPVEVAKELVAQAGEQATEFVGYETLEAEGAKVLALYREGAEQDVRPLERYRCQGALTEGESGGLIFDRSPFYGESGGQVGDRGSIEGDGWRARVTDTQHLRGGLVLHRVEIDEGSVGLGDTATLRVDNDLRAGAVRNHTATHLLHAALREQLGDHVRQAGSLVAPDRLRFDFSHFNPVGTDEVAALERQVNDGIRRDLEMQIDADVSYADAIERGALAFFGDKYGDRVRVVTIPGVSIELCGGTHVDRTGEIGAFVITREESVAAGTRRIEAVTGAEAIAAIQRQRSLVRDVMHGLQSSEEELPRQVEGLLERLRNAEREAESLRVRLASQRASVEDTSDVDGIRVLAREVEELDAAGMRQLADELKSKLGSGVVVLGMRRDGKAQLVVGVTTDLSGRVGADAVVRSLAGIVGGAGGGHAGLAEAGGPAGDRLGEALDRAPKIVAELLG